MSLEFMANFTNVFLSICSFNSCKIVAGFYFGLINGRWMDDEGAVCRAMFFGTPFVGLPSLFERIC